MRIEVLYVEECPSYAAAVRMVEDILATEGLTADVHEILVHSDAMANDLRFQGSPTIRINGRDVAAGPAEPRTFGLSCRFYPGSQTIGLPPAELVRRAVIDARK